MKKATVQKTWHSTPKSEKELETACELLDTDNQSYVIRTALSMAVKQLQKQKERA